MDFLCVLMSAGFLFFIPSVVREIGTLLCPNYLLTVGRPISLELIFVSKNCQISEFSTGGDNSLQVERIF